MNTTLALADQLVELDGLFTFGGLCGEAAAELRRLHAENETGWKEVERLGRERDRLMLENEALRNALRQAVGAVQALLKEQQP